MDKSVRERAKEAVAQCVSNVVRSRRAVRAFKPLPLDRKLVQDILEDAATAPQRRQHPALARLRGQWSGQG